jgi:hypothetical protein
MKCVIGGSRTIQSYPLILGAITSSGFADAITTVFTNMSTGPGIFAYRWAMENKKPVRRFDPEWAKLGKQAGVIGYFEMCAFADAAIIVHDGRASEIDFLLKISSQMDPPLRRHVVNVGPQLQTLADYGRTQT